MQGVHAICIVGETGGLGVAEGGLGEARTGIGNVAGMWGDVVFDGMWGGLTLADNALDVGMIAGQGGNSVARAVIDIM